VNKSLRKLLIQVVLLAATSTIFMSVMPDYLDNVLGVDAEVRGSLEVPRELPGFLLVFIAGYLICTFYGFMVFCDARIYSLARCNSNSPRRFV